MPPKERFKDMSQWLIGFVSAAVTPLIPGLVAGGMLKVFLLLITMAWPAFEEMQTYNLLSMVANIPFYFMPIFVACGAAKKLGSTPLYAMSVAACLVYPNFVELLKGGEPVTIMNILLFALYLKIDSRKALHGRFNSSFSSPGVLSGCASISAFRRCKSSLTHFQFPAPLADAQRHASCFTLLLRLLIYRSF